MFQIPITLPDRCRGFLWFVVPFSAFMRWWAALYAIKRIVWGPSSVDGGTKWVPLQLSVLLEPPNLKVKKGKYFFTAAWFPSCGRNTLLLSHPTIYCDQVRFMEFWNNQQTYETCFPEAKVGGDGVLFFAFTLNLYLMHDLQASWHDGCNGMLNIIFHFLVPAASETHFWSIFFAWDHIVRVICHCHKMHWL